MSKAEIVDFLRYPQGSNITSYYVDLLQKQVRTSAILENRASAMFQVFFITRFCIFELMWTSMQTHPYFQFVSISLFQFGMVILTGIFAFKMRIFQSMVTGFYNFLFDLLLFVYYLVVGVLGFELRERFTFKSYEQIQYACAALLSFIVFFNMVFYFFEIFLAFKEKSNRNKTHVERANRQKKIEEGKKEIELEK
jgi:hypothetical protein